MGQTAKILVLNCGSSSLKYEIYTMPTRESLGKGLVERIGEKMGLIEQKCPKGKYVSNQEIPDHKTAMKLVLTALTDENFGIIEALTEIKGVGHRVVHGGEKYANSVIIHDDVIQAIEENIELAPLHNPPNLTGIRQTIELLPNIKQVAVFDTAYHQTINPAAYLYGIPRKFYTQYKIRRYGFHGTSHRYVAAQALRILKRSQENTNVITCHLGNGASITAIEHGVSVDTSMGFTPLEGLIMGTRSGDIDPSIIFYLLERGYEPDELYKILNKESGLLGLSDLSNDLRDLEKAAYEGNQNAIDAIEAYAYRIRKYIGAYAANLVKVDAIVFTGGVGQHGVAMRQRICNRLENLGIVIDPQKNIDMGSNEGIISKPHSRTSILVVPTNEELQIAIDTYQLIFDKPMTEVPKEQTVIV